MHFATPAFLLAILPWSALTIWLLRAARPSTFVPFVQLWTSTDAPDQQPARRLFRPPASMVFALLAILLAILAAARPTISRASDAQTVLVLLDRGIASAGSEVAWSSFANRTQLEVANAFGASARIEFHALPGNAKREIAVNAIAKTIRQSPATALDTASLLPHTINELLNRHQPLIVLSNQPMTGYATRVMQIPIREKPTPDNIAIVHIGIADAPRPAVMIRLRNDSATTRPIPLSIDIDGKPAVRTSIAPPPSNGEGDSFFDLPTLGNTLRVAIDFDDTNAVDNVAYAVREQSWPAIEPRSPLPAEVRRFIETYKKLRPSLSSSSTRVGIAAAATDSTFANDPNPMALIATDADESSNGPVKVVDHPITRDVQNWEDDLRSARFAKPPPGWQPLVTVGDRVAVAVQEQPARQVWIGFQSDSFATQSDFVIFWTDLIDWLGNASSSEGVWRSEPVHDLGEDWRRDDALSGPKLTADPTTGIFVNTAGRRMAMTVETAHQPAATDFSTDHDDPSQNEATAGTPISSEIAFLAIVSLLVAAICWSSIGKGKILAQPRSVP